MKCFAMKSSMSEMVSLREEGDERMGVKVFLVGRDRENVLVIKEEIRSVEGFGGEAQKRCLMFGT